MKNRIEIRRYCQLIAEINTVHWEIEKSESESQTKIFEENLTNLENELQTILKKLVQE
jgi:hypothetical protein